MKKLAHGLTLFFILSFGATTFATEVSDASLDKLMEVSGLREQMAEIPGMILTGVEQASSQGTEIPEAMLARLYRSIDESFAPEEVLLFVKQELKKSISEEQVAGLMQWYESETGKRIVKAEIDASSPAAYMEMNRIGKSLFENEQRVIMAQTIANQAKSTDLVMDLQLNTAIAVYAAVSMALMPGEKVDIEAFRQQMTSQDELMRDNIEQFVILTLLYSYKDIDPASMEKYLQFLGKEDTVQFNDSVNVGLSQGLNIAITKMAQSLYDSYKKQA
jgi:hypothetical protein